MTEGNKVEVTVEKTNSEWLVSKSFGVSVCVGVENGAVDEVRINGLATSGQARFGGRTALGKLLELTQALNEVWPEIDRAIADTTIVEEREE